jgi:predicted hydrolase (HD superfamily)
MITREEALNYLNANVKNRNLVKHCLASEAVMRGLAERFGRNADEWGLSGLLHDADVETTPANLQGKTIGDTFAEKITPEMRHAMAAHNTQTGVSPETEFDLALTSGETITGLIVAAALVLPEKKLALLTKESIVKRFGEKRFAAGADRTLIMHCEKLGLTLGDFADIALKAMQGISKELGL